MAYARLPDHSPMEAPDEKDDLSIWSPRHLSHLFSYKLLFCASLALWIATLVTFGWVLAHRTSGYGNHAATLMPFPLGMTYVDMRLVLVMLTEISSAIACRHVRAKLKVSLHRQRCRRACLVGPDAQ